MQDLPVYFNAGQDWGGHLHIKGLFLWMAYETKSLLSQYFSAHVETVVKMTCEDSRCLNYPAVSLDSLTAPHLLKFILL